MNDIVEPETVTIESNAVSVAEENALATVAPAAPQAIQEGPGALLGAIVSLAKDPTFDVSKLQALIGLQRDMEDRQAEQAFNRAFVRLQGRLPAVKRRGVLEYPVNKNDPDGAKRKISNFAKWEDIHEAIKPILADEGFALSFRVTPRQQDGGGLMVAAELRHADGHSTVGEPFPVPLDTSGGKNNVQAYGSALSYGKRYSAFAVLNISTEDDDDGVAAGFKRLTDDEVNQLSALVDATATDPRTFFLTMVTGDVTTYYDIDQRDFPRLMNALISKKRKKQAKAGASA